MSDDFGKDYPGDDPFVDPNDPAALEREERRREREAKRQQKSDKKKQKSVAPPPPPKETAPPAPPRTPEQEFWDEPAEPAPPVPGQESALPKVDPAKAERGRRRLFGRRKGKDASVAPATGAAASAPPALPNGVEPTAVPPPTPRPAPPTPPQATADAAPATSEEAVPKAPPPVTGELVRPGGPETGDQPAAKAPSPPTREEPVPAPAGPPTAEQPMPKQPDQPSENTPPAAAAAPAAESPLPPAESMAAASPRPASESPIPDAAEPVGPTAEVPQVDPGPGTAEAPRVDPNQPLARGTAFPPTAEQALPSGAESIPRGRAAPLPLPVEQAGAGDWEPPPPRDDWFDESDEFDEDDLHEGDPEMAGAARHGRRHGEGGGRRGGFFGSILRHPFRIFAVILLIIVLLFLNAFFQPFHGEGSGRVAINIPKGSSVSEVGELLEKKGVISGGFIIPGSTLFQGRVTLSGDRSNLIAGKHVLEKDMSYGDAIDALTTEPKAAEQAKPGIVTVTIPEGQSRPITAKLVKEDGIKGNYLKATKKSKILNPAQYGGKGAKNLEGFLFPDTWELKTKEPVSHLVELQLADFKKKIKKVNMKYANSKNLTIYDVVTIASMIEREASVPKQRKLVASVIYNRLHEGMTLGIDSTIRFATGNYEKPLTESELESESPYNTRTHAGLPPGPINSPGLAALNAAAHPAKTDFLFYVNNPNSCDELTFSKTEEEFLANAAKYEKAREANGGNEPSTCK
jgi:UPF0755 protein